MDISKQVAAEVRSRRRWTIEEKRRITQETFVSGVSVSKVAQRHALNANQLFQWRKKYREGRLGTRTTAKLLPVAITGEQLVEVEKVGAPVPPAPLGIIEMVLPKGKLRIEGRVELLTMRAAIECLL